MAGARQTALLASVLAGALALAATAAAQVPLPTPAPHARQKAPPAAQQPPGSVPYTGAPQQQQPGNPFSGIPALLGFGPKPGTTTATFDPTQRAIVDKVSAYLSGLQVLSGDFVQLGPDGSRSKGQFYIQKPGKVRFEYEPPSPIDIIADGQSVVVRDRRLATQQLVPLSQTPLRYLLTERIDLLRETNIVAITADNLFVSIVIEEKQALVGTNRLMLMFGAQDYELKQWTLTDPQGYDTTVAVSNLDSKRRPDPSLFKIDYTRYQQ
jgi:outer membrane lipoprotein-sorting protein